MENSDLLSNANFFSLLSKIKALKSVLTEEQQKQYSDNLQNIIEESSKEFLKAIPENKQDDFMKIVHATLD